MIKIGVCDDEPAICSELEKMILGFRQKTIEKLDTEIFYSGRDLVTYLRDNSPFDLIFLDIELGDMTGVDIGHIIRGEMDNQTTKIVYITSKSGYDRQLFAVQPLCFLEKPIDSTAVFNAISLAIKLLDKENRTYTFRAEGELHKILVKEIIYFSIHGRKVSLIGEKSSFLFNGTIKEIEKDLADCGFVTPHRSYLINFTHVKKIGENDITMSNNESIYLSRRQSKDIRKLLVTFEEGR